MKLISERFVSEDIAGLDISDSYIAVSRIQSRLGGRVQVRNAGWARIEPDWSPQRISTAIRTLWRECKIPTSTVCSCLHSRSLAVRRFAFSGISEDELDTTIRFDAEEQLQLPSGDLFLDYRVDPYVPEQTHEFEGTFIAAPKEEINAHLSIIRSAGLFPTVVDVPPLAISNIYLELHPQLMTDHPLCLIHLTNRSADIVLMGGSTPLHTHSAYASDGSWANDPHRLVRALSEYLEFSQRKLNFQAPDMLVITGPAAMDPTLRPVLQEGMPLPVQLWDPIKALVANKRARGIQKQVRLADAAMMTTSLGLALRRYSDA